MGEAGAEAVVMGALKSGQRHNASAMKSYDDCRSQQPSIFDFMIVVVSAAPGLPSNFNEAKLNIDWQKDNNAQSINDAKQDWDQSMQVANSQAKKFFQVKAMMDLMFGQRHNPPVMRLYRACFRDDASRLFLLL